MTWREDAEKGLPSRHGKEPVHLRQDILDELYDHLAFAAERERELSLAEFTRRRKLPRQVNSPEVEFAASSSRLLKTAGGIRPGVRSDHFPSTTLATEPSHVMQCPYSTMSPRSIFPVNRTIVVVLRHATHQTLFSSSV